MDSKSLDRCIKTTLSALYPPFQATSPTVLSQVLNVVESCYRGDSLRYLLHFLLPAKQFLQNLQQDASLQYCGLLFRHEGWPLCLSEKVVIHLCPLDQRLLQPGDFYLLVGPAPPSPRDHIATCRPSITPPPCLLLCSVSINSRHVKQQKVSDVALQSLFSMAWLNSVNLERGQQGASRLERCLLSAKGDVFRVPWKELVYPQLISCPRTSLNSDNEPTIKDGDMLVNTSPHLCSSTKSSDQQVKPHSYSSKTDQSAASSENEDSEGEYVELTEFPLPRFSPQKGSLTQSISLQHRTRNSTTANTHSAVTAQTLTNTNSAATQIPLDTNTHAAATAHNTKTTNTHFSRPGLTVSSHTNLCSRLIEENLNRDFCGTLILTSISFASSPCVAPEAVVSSSRQSEKMAQGQIEGTETTTKISLNTETENCTEKTEKVAKLQGGIEEERVELECTEGQRHVHEMSVNEGVGEEKKKDVKEEMQHLEETRCKRDEDLQQHTHADDNESHQSEGVGGEKLNEAKEENLEEVEVEEEVMVVIVKQSPERLEEKVIKEDKVEDGQEEANEETIDEEIHEGSTNSALPKHCMRTYSDESGQQQNYKITTNLQTHSENTNSDNNAPDTLSIGFYCEDSGQYAESGVAIKSQTLSEGSYSEYPIQTYSGDPYCENSTLQSHCMDFYSEYSGYQQESQQSSKPQSNSGDSYFDKSTVQSQSQDAQFKHYTQKESEFENNKIKTQSDVPSVSTSVMDPGSLWTEHDKSGNKEISQEKKRIHDDEESSCEEDDAGRTTELYTEEPRPPAASRKLNLSPSPKVPVQMSQSDFYSVLLNSGAVCLPGTRDKNGRALLTVYSISSVWSDPDFDSAELLRLLLYYTSTLRKEVQVLGLTVLVDARRAAPAPVVFSALSALQENTPSSLHTVFLLVNKDSSLHLNKPIQVEVLSSLKSVQKHVELHQLPAELGGSFNFSQSSWLCYRSRLEQLSSQCEDVIKLLQKTIDILQSTPLPAAEDAEHLLSRYKAVMRSILEDSQLVQLQQEGGASLLQLRRQESSISMTEEYQGEVEAVSCLYNQVDELLHCLVTLSNSRTQELNFILDFRGLEQGFTEVRSWLDEVGELRLKTLEEPADSLELLKRKQQDFREFFSAAYDQCKRGEALLGRLEQWENLSSANLQVYEVKVHSFWARLQDFSQRVKTTGQNIERAVQLYRFLDQAYGWALEGMRHLAGISMDDCTLPDKCQAVISCLEDYKRQHPAITDARFQEMKAMSGELRGERGLRQWSFAWSKCQETKKMFERKMEVALKTRDSAHRQRSDSDLSRSTSSSRNSLSGLWGVNETISSFFCPTKEDTSLSSSPIATRPAPCTSSPPTPQDTPLLHRLFHSFSTDEFSEIVDISSSNPSLCRQYSSACSISNRQQQLRKTQSFDCPPTTEVLRYGPSTRALSEPVCRGNTGVFIRGLEVSSTEAANHTLCPRTGAQGSAGHMSRRGTPCTPRTSSVVHSRPRGSKLRHIVEEMVTTEREYVRSLHYIIHHYFPEMDRVDVPQDLRGKRSIVFGNLEKLLDFHSQFFLRELEACWKHPLRVPHCFLRHQEQFGLYSLYSKNKPKSDSLLLNHGNAFFRRKQVELGDKMDLSSYLLKPVQRMSKYALLLMDLMKEVSQAQETELVALQAATNMVKFQLRHGNDLLAMDAIQDCDVNLKEQGQLIRQDEFTVWSGRRKCQRCIFLFEDLILFSKPKKMEGGLDVFIYKLSFKIADVGLTESTGDSGLRFEIWFRRRTSKNQTFILQAPTEDIKNAWTSDIARILWTQATRNKEMRLKEMVSMGVGNKPFLDIQPSDAAISDRAVHYMKGRGARTRASIAVSVFDHSNPFKSGAVTSDPTAPSPSSSSLLGPLNLHMYSQKLPSSAASENSFITCLEEDEQEHETSSQPSMTTESSGSSSRCLSGSTGSDSGCVSSHLQEALLDEPSPPGHPSPPNKQHLGHPYLSTESSLVISPATIV